MHESGQIPVSEITVGEYAQRIDPEDPENIELAKSIERVGVINPLVVVNNNGVLLLIAGHRRLAAARVAGLSDVPCFVREPDKNVEAEISFAENFHRKDLSPVELGCALKDCVARDTMTIAEIAAGFHRSEHWVHSMIAISSWPEDVQQAMHYAKLSVAAASNLALVTEDTYRAFLVNNAVESGATARTTAAWLQAWREMQPPELAVTAEPMPPGATQVPMIPQAPCLCCSQLFKVNEMSHVPVCGACIQILRTVGQQQAQIE